MTESLVVQRPSRWLTWLMVGLPLLSLGMIVLSALRGNYEIAEETEKSFVSAAKLFSEISTPSKTSASASTEV